MIKIIFFDIDGTLVNRHAKALDSTKRAIALAQSQGILCGVATGRSPIHLSQQIDSLELDVFVTYNGQLVYTEDQTLYERTFTKAELETLVSFADKGNRQMMFGGRAQMDGSSLMKFGQNSKARKLVRFIPSWFPVAMVKRLLDLLRYRFKKENCRYHELDIINESIYQCVLLSPENEMDELKKQLPDCTITRSNPYVVDIIPKGGSKLKGIAKCIESFDISLSEVMVFGDNWNDVEMLQGSGIGVAMGNAPEGVKAVADFVTNTNENHGIYEAMVHYGIIEEAAYEN